MARGRRQGGRTAPAPDAPVNTQETAIPMPNTDVTARRSPMGVRGPQDQMTEGTGQVSSRRNVPGPKARTERQRAKEIVSGLSDVQLGQGQGQDNRIADAARNLNTGPV